MRRKRKKPKSSTSIFTKLLIINPFIKKKLFISLSTR